MRRCRVSLALAGAAVLLLAATAPATAIIDGTTDTTNRFPNVGGLQLQLDGVWFDFCTGTLVAPNVVLTAAHCTDFFTGDVGDPAASAAPADPTAAEHFNNSELAAVRADVR